ncbi:hypothetical protein MPSEU_000188100 [Mayamaea pseudoterrestris]|nr:hypothetical protein MPSEU_000188100 [Mayamaea pseudoterrestris]
MSSLPVPLKPDEVSAHLTCAICLEVPMSPVAAATCEHMFCQACISALKQSSDCPTCRVPYTEMVPLKAGSLSYRLWTEITMKCGNHEHGCNWTGSIVDAEAHYKSCQAFGRTKELEQKIELFKKECETLKADMKRRDAELGRLTTQLRTANDQSAASSKQRQELQSNVRTLKLQVTSLQATMQSRQDELECLHKQIVKWKSHLIGKLLVPEVSLSTYNYGRDSVVALSQIISRFIDNKPDTIDRNKIYGCVRALNDALEKNRGDNPVGFETNMRMLLVTCLASNWFTNNQCYRFEQWMTKQGWS